MTHTKQKLSHYLHEIFISFYYSKSSLFLFSLFPMIYWKHEFFETMQSYWGFFSYYRKLFLTFGFKKIVFLSIWLLNFQRKFRILVFLAGIWKKSVPSNYSICEVSHKNKKYLHLEQKMINLGIFGLEFEKATVIFEINGLQFFKLESLVQNKNP